MSFIPQNKILEKALELAVNGDRELVERYKREAETLLNQPSDKLAGITASALEKASKGCGFTE